MSYEDLGLAAYARFMHRAVAQFMLLENTAYTRAMAADYFARLAGVEVVNDNLIMEVDGRLIRHLQFREPKSGNLSVVDYE